MTTYDATLPVADRVEIHELYARYAHAADACDGEVWAACFTRDATFVPSVHDTAGRMFRGRAELAAFIADPARPRGRFRHWVSAVVLEAKGEAVSGRCYGTLLDVSSADAPVFTASVVYRDEIVREDGRWLFATRRPVRDGR